MTSRPSRQLLLASLLLGASPIAVAQGDAPSEDSKTLETVIVTGVGPQRETSEMIGNASVVNREDLVAKLSGTLGDTLATEPGVSTSFFGQGASRPILRGLGAERVLVLTNGIGVIDVSAASPDHQVAADGIDAEKVEILRGPAALAYGGQAIGGVVNVIDGLIAEDLPEQAISGEAMAALNSVNDGSEAAGRLQLSRGSFVLNLSVSARDFDDYDIPGFAESSLLRSMEEHDHEEEEEMRDTLENTFLETNTHAAGLSWVGENGFLGISIRQQEASYGLPGHSHAHEHEDEEGEEEEDHEDEEHEEETPFVDLTQTRYDIRGGMKLDFGPITDIAGSLAIADYEHTEFEAPGEPGTAYETDGSEGRLEVGTLFGEVDGAVGLQFLDKAFAAFGDERFITPTDTKAKGVFLFQTFEWADDAGVEGGLRFDKVEYDNLVHGQRDFDVFSGSLGSHGHLAGSWFTGLQLSYTERAPNESELFADGAHLATRQYEVGNTGLKKERGTNIEATLRWQTDMFEAGMNLFVADFRDFIYLTPGVTIHDGSVVDEVDELPVYLFQQENADFTGGEIYATWQSPDGLFAADWVTEASLDFVDGKLDSGGNVPLLPPVTLRASTKAAWNHFSLGGSITHAADQDDPGAGSLPTDGYTTLGLRLGIDLASFGLGQEGTEIFVDGRNLTDEEVRYATSVLKDFVPAPGRNIRAGLRLTF